MISIVASWIWNLKSNSILQEKGKEKEGGETKEEKRQEEQEHHFSNIPNKTQNSKEPPSIIKIPITYYVYSYLPYSTSCRSQIEGKHSNDPIHQTSI